MGCARVREHFGRFGRLRILVIGRANAGKTTLLQRICNTTEFPEIFNAKGEKRGDHDIENELIFKSNPGVIFHDSQGFESGSLSEWELVRRFIMARAVEKEFEKQIHVIWFCIPLSESERPIVAAEERFFESTAGNVPVITVLTKADTLQGRAIGQLRDEGMQMKEAFSRAGELAKQILIEARAKIESLLSGCKYPPKAYVTMASKYSLPFVWGLTSHSTGMN
ncbi:hypothetical protein SCLCIDRAFT_119883 [Scleroderma citrinum Foug A]|uniref:G domain-containing protein n=1 Tax=Scleroderma citrinum Foug A TaxID=1036808 RepID=A0A0C3E2N0_9AGAM|nr:hypothetical protein SCLCIDRAFT_119883 [Scleroderma citrinum Foug A]